MAVILTLGIISGFALLMYGAFFLKDDAAGNTKALEKIQMSVEEADNTLSNINSVSSLIISEIDMKYKELLFLYQMLEERKKELLDHSHEQAEQNVHAGEWQDYEYDSEESDAGFGRNEERTPNYKSDLEIMEIGRKMDEVRRFPKLQNQNAILELHSKGRDITDIAKELAIGKGEVRLILGLNKVGVGYE